MTMEINLDSHQTVKISRSKENQKQRPNLGGNRHDPFKDNAGRRNSIKFVHNTDLEWLSLNWRKFRAF